jgi:hypothetical protein
MRTMSRRFLLLLPPALLALDAIACDVPCENTLTCPGAGPAAGAGGDGNGGPGGSDGGGGAGAGGAGGVGGGGLLANGAPCDDAGECESGACADDVCCDTVCDGACESCAGDTVGTCLPTPAGSNEAGECDPGICDGSGSCAIGTHVWSRGLGDTGFDRALGVAIDSQGNVIVCGAFEGTVNFGGMPITANGGNQDLFLAKYEPDGDHIWSMSFHGSEVVSCFLGVDDNDDIVLAGSYEGTLLIGGDTMPSDGTQPDVYVIHVTAAGNAGNHDKFGDSAAAQRLTALAVAPDGSYVLAGDFRGSINLGGSVLTAVLSSQDVFVGRFDNADAHVFSNRFGDGTDEHLGGAVITATDEVWFSGQFDGTVNFGGSTLSSIAGSSDLFIARFGAAGGHLWSDSFGGAEDEEYAVLAAQGDGVVLSASFDTALELGGDCSLTAPAANAFIAGFDVTGTCRWFKTAGAPLLPFGVATDGAGNVVSTGTLPESTTANFGGSNLVAQGFTDMYYVKLAADGEHLWSGSAGSAALEQGTAAATGPDGEVAFTGYYGTTAIGFGGPLLPGGSVNGLVVKFAP